jgi:hypothetical protein
MASPEAGYAEAVRTISDVAAMLGDSTYLCSAEPSTAECGIWANMVHAAISLKTSTPREAVRASAPLIA